MAHRLFSSTRTFNPMTAITPDTTIGTLVADDARRTRVFERLGIDYCCGGSRTLAEACQTEGLDPQTVAQVLAAAEAAQGPAADSVDWAERTLSDLIDHIERTHHAFLREELPRLTGLVHKVARVHGDTAPWMVSIKDVFDDLRVDLEAHMQKEEAVVFPMIRALEVGELHTDKKALGDDDPIHLMEEEHDAAGAALKRLRTLSDGYTPPADACGTFRAALEGLARLEADMHQHVHKENNLLFPRARQLG
jgi:regulator of cell morphogenesis and NO signaling